MRATNTVAGIFLAVGFLFFGSTPAWSACSFGTGSGELSLQTILFQRLSVAPQVMHDCIPDEGDDYWYAHEGAAATILIELAGYASQSTFGIYDSRNSANRLQVFAGADDAFDTRRISVTPAAGGYRVEIGHANSNQVMASALFTSDQFGFYMKTPQSSGTVYFSDTRLNPDGVDHMYAYQGNDSTFLRNNYVPQWLRGQTFEADMHLLAWEDLLNGGDRDYQDMVILTRSVAPVPLPASVGLLLAGLAVLARRRFVIRT